MRLISLITTILLSLVSLGAQDLATFDPTTGVVEFDAALESHMTRSGNAAAREAYANFTGVFFGGGFSEAQQKQIAATSVQLAGNRISATGGFIDYLGALAALVGDPEQENNLFSTFHDALGQLLAKPELRVNEVNNSLNTANVLANERKFVADKEGSGWVVTGGKMSFVYADDGFKARLDTVRQLRAISAKDTLTIQETNLLVDLNTSQVEGRGGRTDWRRVGLAPEVFVILVQYAFDGKRMIYESDSAQFQYPEYFDDEILVGSFADKIQAGGVREEGEFPRFVSDDGFVEIKNIGKNVSLFGNFELRGSTVYAIGSEQRDARVRLRLQGSATDRTVEGEGRRFTVREGNTITGESIRTVIRVGKDSLSHPSVTMHVKTDERVVSLRRTDNSADQAPFYHSRNGMAIFSDYIDIYLEGDSAIIGKPTVSFQEQPDVVLESADYFSEREYENIQDIGSTNPLERIYVFREKMNGGLDDFHADDLAKSLRKDYTATKIQPLLFDLQERGFLLYHSETQRVSLKPKLVHYVESQREEIDYDKLRVVSRTRGTNAVMNLVTGDIRVNAVLPLEFNRKKQLAILPEGDQLVVKGNRDMDFSGQIFAGGLVLAGKDFHFKYAPYHIKLDSVRYVDLFTPKDDKFNEAGKTERLSAGSRIEHLTGYLLLDAPKNKSGTEDIPYFPSLQSKDVSYIYYDQADSLANYGRDDFYFELQPFSLNGTDSLLGRDIALAGKLNSGGIFPDFEESLKIQEDGSLGFVTTTPEGGQGTYDGRGNYEGEIVLTNRGLEGSGKLTYLESTIESTDLKFGLDNTRGSSNSFGLEESTADGRIVPQVRGNAVAIELIPYGDSLVITPTEGETFAMFKAGEHQFDGGLVLTPDALKANGTLDWSAASMTSRDMSFTLFGARADTSDVSIKSLGDGNQLALTTTNVQSDVNFDNQVATFRNNTTDLATYLPYNQYRTSINQFDWDMAGGNITFQAQTGKDRFTSTHPDQDSLTFTGDSASYDINTSVLTVRKIPYIVVADARIYPGDGIVQVEGGAAIKELTNARIVADTINEYHIMNRATVQIGGRKEYTASGFYEYNVGGHTQEVEFQNIVGTRVGKGRRDKKATATRAEGTVKEDADFYIDDKTKFFGSINLDAGSKTLFFDGYAKVDAERLPDAQWFTVRSEGDKKNLSLAIAEPKDRDGAPLFTGLYLSKPNRGVYPSIVQSLDFRKDHPILDANGTLSYDEENDAFLLGDSARIFNPEARTGNLMRLDNGSGKVTGSGKLGLGGRLKYVSVSAYGNVETEMPTGPRVALETEPEPEPAEEDAPVEETAPPSMFLLEEETTTGTNDPNDAADNKTSITIEAPVTAPRPDVLLEAMLVVDLILPDKLVNLMATDVLSGTYASPNINLAADRAFYETGIETLFPKSQQRAASIASVSVGVLEIPREINEHTFVFPKMKMKWSEDYQSFVSTEKQNGLGSIRGNTISKMVEAHVEVKMPSGGDDRLYIYVKSPSEQYYFFGFKDGILNVVSNNSQFMNELEGMKAREVVLEMEDGETYEILPVSPATAETFLRRVRDAFGD
ncbi:hypothetical protein [Neolewinella antarctica]|uniref:Uncharacterized protein n=1 Tax=Neolewinella antarctica TaxID=442734 RepID=A0ABX0X631_9BACT|nr:hypothetical protein [Neolewinella antarctica]NJC24592.1 hypothetical protein [Neolewinella antarctica]